MYADRKGWPLESVTVRAEHGRIHAKDCEECETKSGRIDRVQLELELEGPLDTEQCEKLREIAEKCPVKRTLDSETLIEIRAAMR
jgi:putative redox protein